MGCDIHTMVEIKRQRYKDRNTDEGWRWVKLDAEELHIPNPYHDPDSESEYWRKQPKYTDEPFGERNYDLFALLADVRNGFGFAGVPRHQPIVPLSEPRGVPDDASHAWLETVEQWDSDMHSHTYFTLQELLDFQAEGRFGQGMRRTGAITAEQYEKIKASGFTLKPDGWSGSVSGNGIVTISPDQYDAGSRAPEFPPEELAEMRARWKEAKAKRGEVWTDADDKRFDEWTGVPHRTYIQYHWEDSMEGSVGALVAAIEAAKRFADDRPPLDKLGEPDYQGKKIEDEPGWHGHGGIPYENIRFVMGFDN